MAGNGAEGYERVAQRWWDYSLSRDNSLVTDYFQGQFLSITRCQSCKHESLCCDTF